MCSVSDVWRESPHISARHLSPLYALGIASKATLAAVDLPESKVRDYVQSEHSRPWFWRACTLSLTFAPPFD